MTNSKIDPALMQVLVQLAASGRSDQQVPVIIEHVEPAEVIGQDDLHAQVSELAQQMRKLQEGIVQRLRDLGVRSAPQQLVLAYEVRMYSILGSSMLGVFRSIGLGCALQRQRVS